MQISTPGKEAESFIQEASRCVTHTLESPTPFKVPDLGPFRRPPVDAGTFETGSSAVFCSDLLDLLSQFSSWSQHQTLGSNRKGDSASSRSHLWFYTSERPPQRQLKAKGKLARLK